MTWFTNLTTRAKLLTAFGLMILLFAVTIATAYASMAAARETASVLLTLTDLRGDEHRQHGRVLELMLGIERDVKAVEEDLAARAAEIDRTLDRVADFGGDDRRFLIALDELREALSEWRESREAQLDLVRQQELTAARDLATEEGQVLLFERVRGRTDRLGELAAERAETVEKRSQVILLSVGALAVVLAVGMTSMLNRLIAAPLKDVTAAAERVAGGDLSEEIPVVDRRDEVGRLAETFVTMLRTLRSTTRELAEGASLLGSSANEIAASTSQLSSGAAETASAVSQTTSTVEQVHQSAQLATEKAKRVSETATRAAEGAREGRAYTQENITGMASIREQMDAIAQSMTRLSEQSQAIGQIISTVEDLAQQSNLLAVNAAIEAANAGEYGKGFAVVAQEVRSLAEQSKQATAQVRRSLGDIQSATSTAVMATERGTKAVEAGVEQSDRTGEAIGTLVASITESAEAGTQIAAAVNEQLEGMDQITTAMESINQASNQNVESARQLEVAARDLSELGQRLEGLTRRFRIVDERQA